MPRTKATGICLLCDEIPCVCFGEKSPKKRIRKTVEALADSTSGDAPANESVPVRAARGTARSRMKAAAAEPTVVQCVVVQESRPVSATDAAVTTVLPQPPSPIRDSDVLNSAIKCLANSEMLHPDELQNYSVLLNGGLTVSDRSILWRSNHATS